MKNKIISGVKPLKNHILQVDFVSGSRVLLDLSEYIHSLRFRPLKDETVWCSAVTNGMFVRFGDVELSHNEILEMIEMPRKQSELVQLKLNIGASLEDSTPIEEGTKVRTYRNASQASPH